MLNIKNTMEFSVVFLNADNPWDLVSAARLVKDTVDRPKDSKTEDMTFLVVNSAYNPDRGTQEANVKAFADSFEYSTHHFVDPKHWCVVLPDAYLQRAPDSAYNVDTEKVVSNFFQQKQIQRKSTKHMMSVAEFIEKMTDDTKKTTRVYILGAQSVDMLQLWNKEKRDNTGIVEIWGANIGLSRNEHPPNPENFPCTRLVRPMESPSLALSDPGVVSSMLSFISNTEIQMYTFSVNFSYANSSNIELKNAEHHLIYDLIRNSHDVYKDLAQSCWLTDGVVRVLQKNIDLSKQEDVAIIKSKKPVVNKTNDDSEQEPVGSGAKRGKVEKSHTNTFFFEDHEDVVRFSIHGKNM